MERVILHCDANAFYASVECLYTPSIRHSPVAVCGSVEERHGIVLTKNQIAKQFGVQTGEAIWQARQKCPDLICVPPAGVCAGSMRNTPTVWNPSSWTRHGST